MSVYINNLPDCLLLAVLSVLTPLDLARCAGVCTAWRSLALTALSGVRELCREDFAGLSAGQLHLAVRLATTCCPRLVALEVFGGRSKEVQYSRRGSLGSSSRSVVQPVQMTAHHGAAGGSAAVLPAAAGPWASSRGSIFKGWQCSLLTQLTLIDVHISNLGLVEVARNCGLLTSVTVGHLQRAVSDCPVSDEGLSTLASRCVLLDSVGLLRCCVSDVGLRALALHRGADLRALRMHNCKQVTRHGVLLLAEGCPRLASLDVLVPDPYLAPSPCRHACLDFTAVFALAANCSSLKELRVSEEGLLVGSLDDSALSVLAEGCSQLEVLELWQVDVNDTSLCRLAACCPRLRVLQLHNTYVGDATLVALSKHCPDLQEICIAGCGLHGWSLGGDSDDGCFPGVTEKGLQVLGAKCSRLQRVQISGLGRGPSLTAQPLLSKSIALQLTHLDLDWIRYSHVHLTEQLRVMLLGCSSLQQLSLVGYEGCTDLLLLGCPVMLQQLRVLNLSSSDVTDSGLQAVARKCRRLQRLVLASCESLTAAGIVNALAGPATLQVGTNIVRGGLTRWRSLPISSSTRWQDIRGACMANNNDKGCSSTRSSSNGSDTGGSCARGTSSCGSIGSTGDDAGSSSGGSSTCPSPTGSMPGTCMTQVSPPQRNLLWGVELACQSNSTTATAVTTQPACVSFELPWQQAQSNNVCAAFACSLTHLSLRATCQLSLRLAAYSRIIASLPNLNHLVVGTMGASMHPSLRAQYDLLKHVVAQGRYGHSTSAKTASTTTTCRAPIAAAPALRRSGSGNLCGSSQDGRTVCSGAGPPHGMNVKVSVGPRCQAWPSQRDNSDDYQGMLGSSSIDNVLAADLHTIASWPALPGMQRSTSRPATGTDSWKAGPGDVCSQSRKLRLEVLLQSDEVERSMFQARSFNMLV